jgi:hypothetical protein
MEETLDLSPRAFASASFCLREPPRSAPGALERDSRVRERDGGLIREREEELDVALSEAAAAHAVLDVEDAERGARLTVAPHPNRAGRRRTGA